MKIIQYNYGDYIIFFWMMDEMGWYDELVMVYVIGSINSRLLRFGCSVALFLFVFCL